jgi:hypothetical protein
MGRAGRGNVKRKEVEITTVNPALLRRQTGVLGKSKNQNKTFLTGPTSLEMVIIPVAVEKLARHEFAEIASRQEAL